MGFKKRGGVLECEASCTVMDEGVLSIAFLTLAGGRDDFLLKGDKREKYGREGPPFSNKGVTG